MRLVLLGLAALPLVAGCGRLSQDPSETSSGSPSAAGNGSQAPAETGGSASTPEGGAAGDAGESPAPPMDIAGRWALFLINDPVGVQLVQSGELLTGEGCAAGTPPISGVPELDICGALSGEVHGNTARFHFIVDTIGGYADELTVSADGQRMTGRLQASFPVWAPTAWLRVPDGDPGLRPRTQSPSTPLSGGYRLELEESLDLGTEYEPSETYRLAYRDNEGISSDLGSFWHTELSQTAEGGSIEVGPVPITSPQLAVSMTLEVEAESVTRVHATTGSGHRYRFRATRAQ